MVNYLAYYFNISASHVILLVIVGLILTSILSRLLYTGIAMFIDWRKSRAAYLKVYTEERAALGSLLSLLLEIRNLFSISCHLRSGMRE
jgi:hypothetical protein